MSLDFPELFDLLLAMANEFSEEEFFSKLVPDDYFTHDGAVLLQINWL